MLGLIVRGLLIIAASIAGWLVAADATNFGVVQMVIAVLLFVLFVFVLAFWPLDWFARLGGWFRRKAG